jgi:hypothetical protein
MGGSQSREDDERAAVVKRVENKDGQVTVEISEELVKDIHEKYAAGPGEEIVAPSGGHQDPPVVHSESSPSTNHLLLELEREKLKNEQYKSVTLAEIGKTSRNIERKIADTPLAKVTPICYDLAGSVSRCYVSNQEKTLNCSQEVKEYLSCVERQMKVCL